MSAVFIKFLDISIIVSFAICALIILRLLLKKVPAFIRCIVWGLVALRLLIPINLESDFSLIPRKADLSQTVKTEVPALQEELPTLNESTPLPPMQEQLPPAVDVAPPEEEVPSLPDTAPEAEKPVTDKAPVKKDGADIWKVLSVIWICGGALMLCYLAASYLFARRKVRNAVVYDDRIYICHGISPFVLGFIKPSVYLPTGLTEAERLLIIRHEKAHLKRGDHLSKPLGFLVLTLHWFNPFVWVAYLMFCRDVEFACDEKVIKTMDSEERQKYSLTLLKCSTGKRISVANPLAFGEVGSKERITKVMKYKKPVIWIACIGIVVCVAVLLCFGTSPRGKGGGDDADIISESSEVSAESSEESGEESGEYNPALDAANNYALGCKYKVYRNNKELTAGSYLAGFEDLELTKLTDGIISYEDAVFYTHGNSYVTIWMDLGEERTDASTIVLKNVYEGKYRDHNFDFHFYPYFSSDDVNYISDMCGWKKINVKQTDKYTVNDYYFYIDSLHTYRYLKIELAFPYDSFGLDEIMVCKTGFDTGGAADLKWDVSNDQTLTIRGEGSMEINAINAPWKPFASVIKKVVIEEGITSVGPNAFEMFEAMTEVVLPSTLTAIGSNAFNRCSALKSVTIPEGVTDIYFQAFEGCSALKSLSLPDSLITISNAAFKDCRALTELNLPQGLLEIGVSAFANCVSLKEISLPDSVTTIGTWAFDGCEGLKVKSLPKHLSTVGIDAFPDNAFGDTLTIPKHVVGIEYNAFGKQNRFVVDSENQNFTAENGVLFNKDKTELIAYPVLSDTTEYTVPHSVNKILYGAFMDAQNLTSVTLPQGLEVIEHNAFQNCAALKSISIPDSVTEIGNFAFSECGSLEKAILSSSLEKISEYMFYRCSQLKEVAIPDNVLNIGTYAFAQCTVLQLTELPDRVLGIGAQAFSDCNAIESMVLPKHLEYIGNGAFISAGLKTVTIPEDVTHINATTFQSCRDLAEVYLPSTLRELDISAFGGCSALKKVSFGGTLEEWLDVQVVCGGDGWASMENICGAQVQCTDGTGYFMTRYRIDWNGDFYNSGYATYDGTLQDMVNALGRSNFGFYIFEKGIKVNSLHIENTEDEKVKIAHIDLSEEFSKGFERYPQRRNCLMYDLAATLLNNHPQLDYNDMVQISVNGEVISDTKGITLIKDLSYFPPEQPIV